MAISSGMTAKKKIRRYRTAATSFNAGGWRVRFCTPFGENPFGNKKAHYIHTMEFVL